MKIYLFGASGSGTTSLGQDLSNVLTYPHFDADDYYWIPTKPPFQQKREREERIAMLAQDLTQNEDWILSGSMTSWGEKFIPLFDLAIYLSIPKEIRLARLTKREGNIFGEAEIKPGGKWHRHFNEFIEWASRYDEGGLGIRSKTLHAEWMKTFSCPILRIEGDVAREERVQRVLEKIKNIG